MGTQSCKKETKTVVASGNWYVTVFVAGGSLSMRSLTGAVAQRRFSSSSIGLSNNRSGTRLVLSKYSPSGLVPTSHTITYGPANLANITRTAPKCTATTLLPGKLQVNTTAAQLQYACNCCLDYTVHTTINP